MPDHDVVIVGAGFSGIGAAILLEKAGFSDYLVVEEGDGVGGAWHWNTYPGIAVDIPSFSYQFSFETRGDWSRVYAPGVELKRYAEHCVDKYRVRDRIRFNTRITGAAFDEAEDVWRLETRDGDTITARFAINAAGALSQPKIPADLPGVEDFAGVTMHTSRWDHDVDLRGKRVGIIGTGASAVQVIPAIAPEAATLTVFQRTPVWCLPKPDRPLGRRERWVLEHVPGARAAARLLSQAFVELNFPLAAHFYGIVPLADRGEKIGRKFLEREVRDPVVRDKLTPRYGLGCKRPTFHNEYLATFNRDNVTLETAAIERVTPAGVRTTDGEHELDVLLLATGFRILEPIFPVYGAGGVELDAWWNEHRMQAYEGVSVPGFPNLFHIIGPYGFNGASFFLLIETQMRHITRCLRRARERGATRVEITREANERYWRQMLGRRHNQIFFRDTCATANSYYFDRHGDVPFRASPSLETIWRAARFDLDDYRFETARF